MANRFGVIDADAHVNPEVTFWADYLPAELRDRAPRLEEGDQVDYVVFEGQRAPFNRISAQAGAKPEEMQATGKISATRAGGWDASARIEDMDIDGVDVAAIFGGGPLATADGPLHLASFHAYNTWLADFCAKAPDRLLGMAYLPMFDVDAAIAELEWASTHGLRGVVVPPYAPTAESIGGGLNFQNVIMYSTLRDDRSYADDEFRPFWSRACDLGLPVHVHLGAAPKVSGSGPDAEYVRKMRSKLAMADVVTHFIMTGLLPRYPDLKLVSVEGGVGWMAFCAEYMDETWHKHRYATNSVVTQEPSTYMSAQVYGTFLHDAAGVNNRNLKGAGNIMWSSDYPHGETTWPNSRDAIARSLGDLPDAERHRLLVGNAATLYDLR
jgi:predicted TIM-barrel fold metal-dependent hydrolase